MAKKTADAETVKLIYQLASEPDTKVKVGTKRADWEMFALRISVYDICDAIRNWIDAGKSVEEGITQKKPHQGKPHYVMKPVIGHHKMYIKAGIERDESTGEMMIIISAHP